MLKMFSLRPLKHRTKVLQFQTLRKYSTNPFSKAIKQEFGISNAADEFLPDQEERELEELVKFEARAHISKRPDSMLRHGTEFNGVMYKYDLPVENSAIVFKSN